MQTKYKRTRPSSVIFILNAMNINSVSSIYFLGDIGQTAYFLLIKQQLKTRLHLNLLSIYNLNIYF